MKKTVEQLTKEFAEIMAANGFEATNETDYAGNILYSRRWERDAEVLWHGMTRHEYEIVANRRPSSNTKKPWPPPKRNSKIPMTNRAG